MPTHVPVMRAEVAEWLAPGRGGVFVDCTVGLGGHADALLESGASRVIGLDRDREALAAAGPALARWGSRVELIHSDFRRLALLLDERGLAAVDGVLADLGVSSLQFEGEGRGFSFQRDEPLDMRMDRSRGRTAAELLAAAGESQLADIIFGRGEERFSRRIARAIVAARERGPVATTGQLATIVRRAVPRTGRWRIDPATRTFQALRIAVNGELDDRDRFLAEAAGRLRRRPARRHVSLARRSHREAHVPPARRGRDAVGEGGHAQAAAAVGRRDRAEPAARSAKPRVIERAA
jgi:16S rRNA (cytosine1402-N4)-methyltransferase